MKKFFVSTILTAAFVALSARPSDGVHTFHIFSTNDVHGSFFDSLYVGTKTQPSLLAVSSIVNEARQKYGKRNVLLLDVGDALQGNNASFYFNRIDTVSNHVFARMAEYMEYDALIAGNHDIETGHSVYDRFVEDVEIPYMAMNAIREDNGRTYFDDYVVLVRNGIKFLILGYDNANIKGWLSPTLWSGMQFLPIMACAQADVDRLRAKVKPDVVIVAAHTGTGEGDGRMLESEGLDLLNSLKGVDFLFCAHDHRPHIARNGDFWLINSGSHCRNVGHAEIELEVRRGKVVARRLRGENIAVDKTKTDERMRELFARDYAAVKKFATRRVGRLEMPLISRKAYAGMSDYINLIHTVCLRQSGAQISFAAPLTFNGYVREGDILYTDLATIYPYENQLYIINMTGEQIRKALEYSYDGWINTWKEDGNVLKIANKPDSRTSSDRWSFVGRTYNFDSAAGINYTVDITRDYGNRVHITSLAGGEPFDENATYSVALTSYRASGGGGHLSNGAGIDTDRIGDIVTDKLPDIRNLIYDFLQEYPEITPETVGDRKLLGEWRFVPEDIAGKAIGNDMHLVFPKYE